MILEQYLKCVRLVVCDGFSIEKCEKLWLQLYVSFFTTKYKIWDIIKNNQLYDKWNEVLLWKNTNISMRIKNVQNCDEMWLYAYIFEVWHAFLKPTTILHTYQILKIILKTFSL